MRHNQSIFVIGGSDAGKTNYINRLWLSIHQTSGVLQFDGLPDDMAHLDEGSSYLLKGQFVPHTSHAEMNRIEMPFKHSDGTQEHQGLLVVPDRAGEEWKKLYHQRYWSQEWEDLVAKSSGCLIFVRADSEQIEPMMDFIRCQEMFGSASNPLAPDTASVATVNLQSQNRSEQSDDAEYALASFGVPTEVLIVDWLQCLLRAFADHLGGSFRPRVGFVISAWDAVPNDRQEKGAAAYLEKEFPMLWQFMQTNTDAFTFQAFGLSVTGCDLKVEAKRRQYLKNPFEAGYVVHALNGYVERQPDVSLPVAWALGFINAPDFTSSQA